MMQWSAIIAQIRNTWISSNAWDQLRNILHTSAAHTTHIKKTVYFGLAALQPNRDRDDYEVVLQHLIAFSIVTTLAAL